MKEKKKGSHHLQVHIEEEYCRQSNEENVKTSYFYALHRRNEKENLAIKDSNQIAIPNVSYSISSRFSIYLMRLPIVFFPL